MPVKPIASIIILVLAASCTINRKNMPEDNEKGKTLAKQFYNYILNGQRDVIDDHLGTEITPESMNRTFYLIDSMMGHLKSFEIDAVESDVTEAKGEVRGNYGIRATCTYDSGTTTETLNIQTLDSSFWYTGYHATKEIR